MPRWRSANETVSGGVPVFRTTIATEPFSFRKRGELEVPVSRRGSDADRSRPFARVALQPGQARRVTFRLHADRTSFHDRSGTRIVEPGVIEVEVGASSADPRLTGSLLLHGPERAVGPDRALTTPVSVQDG